MKRRKFFAACAGAVAGAFVPADVSAAPSGWHVGEREMTQAEFTEWFRERLAERIEQAYDFDWKRKVLVFKAPIERVNVRVTVRT